MLIRKIHPAEASEWEAMRRNLWPGHDADHAAEIPLFFAGTLPDVQAVLVAEEAGRLIAFAELSLRDDLEGLRGKLVGYVEGLYVLPEFRGGGATLALLRESRRWARTQGCDAFASDRADRVIVDHKF